MEGKQISTSLKWTRILFFVNAVVWLTFGILSLLFRALDNGGLIRWAITVFMLINGFLMIWFGIVIVKGQPQVFVLAIVYQGLNVVLSFADQFGWVDALILLLNFCLLGSLLVAKHRMNQAFEAT